MSRTPSPPGQPRLHRCGHRRSPAHTRSAGVSSQRTQLCWGRLGVGWGRLFRHHPRTRAAPPPPQRHGAFGSSRRGGGPLRPLPEGPPRGISTPPHLGPLPGVPGQPASAGGEQRAPGGGGEGAGAGITKRGEPGRVGTFSRNGPSHGKWKRVFALRSNLKDLNAAPTISSKKKQSPITAGETEARSLGSRG